MIVRMFIKLCDSIKEIQKIGNLKFQKQDRKFKNAHLPKISVVQKFSDRLFQY